MLPMIHIYYAYIAKYNHDRLIQDHLPGFSSGFQQKIHKYRRWEDAQLSLLGRLLLKHGFNALNEPYYDNFLDFNKYNKPFFRNHRIRFNISHSGNLTTCALTENTDIGIDVEFLDEVNIQDFKFQMTPEEWNRISSSLDPNLTFFDYWTQKEAIIKAYGLGLSLSLNSFIVLNNRTKINNKIFCSKEIILEEDYKCHLAWDGDFDLNVNKPQLVIF